MDRDITVRLAIDYDLTIPNDMKMDEVRDLIVDHIQREDLLPGAGIIVNNRSEDRLIRTRKFKN